MATAKMLTSAEQGERKVSLYELSMPVLDYQGYETMVVMVSQLPKDDGAETAILPVFLCPVHLFHESIFALNMQDEMLMDKCSDVDALRKLGYSVE
jgi:hypothetical protein